MGFPGFWRIRDAIWRVTSVFRKRRSDAELDEELGLHLELLAEDNRRKGMSSEQARNEARRALGGLDRTREEYRAQRGIPVIDELAQDLRYGLRQLRKSPGFAATAIVTLALGIGANTAVFALIYGLMLRNLPVPHPEQLVRYRLAPLPTNPSYSPFSSFALSDFGVLSGPMFESIRRNQRACTNVFGWKSYGELDYSKSGESRLINAAVVTGSAFSVLGIKPDLGRLLDESDDSPGGGAGGWSADISYGFWQNDFHGDPTATGRTIVVNNVPVKIAGVLPRKFEGVWIGSEPQIVLPLEIDSIFAAVRSRPAIRHNKYFSQLTVMGRLKPGVSIQQARANAASIQEAMWDDAMPPVARHNQFVTTQRLDVTSASAGWSSYRQVYEKPLLIVQALIAIVLILIVANLSGLLLARTASRRQELEIRGALGASRFRLIRQLLTETAILAAIGIPIGCMVAWRASIIAERLLFSHGSTLALDRWHDPAVLAFAAASGLLTALVAGLLPSLVVTRTVQAATLQAGRRQSYSGRHGRLGKALIPTQVALSLILVAVAGLFVASLARLLITPTGMKDQGVFVARTNLEHLTGKEDLRGRYERMLENLKVQPGVQSASLVLHVPMTGGIHYSHFATRDSTGAVHEDKYHMVNAVASGFFQTLGIPILEGRDFASTDTASSPGVCILSQSAARFFFPGLKGAMGEIVEAPQDAARSRAASYTVVGIVGDAKYDTLHQDAPAIVYIPFTQQAEEVSPSIGILSPRLDMSFVMKGTDPKSLSSAYRKTMNEFAAGTPLYPLRSLHRLMLDSISSDRLIASLSGFLGLLALLLTCISLYGQVAWNVTERTSEIGIRMALGATRAKVVRMIVASLVLPTAIGTIAGLAGAIGVSKIIASWLYDTRPVSPAPIAGSIASMLVVAAIASFLPARRAASIDPMKCLRSE